MFEKARKKIKEIKEDINKSKLIINLFPGKIELNFLVESFPTKFSEELIKLGFKQHLSGTCTVHIWMLYLDNFKYSETKQIAELISEDFVQYFSIQIRGVGDYGK